MELKHRKSYYDINGDQSVLVTPPAGVWIETESAYGWLYLDDHLGQKGSGF